MMAQDRLADPNVADTVLRGCRDVQRWFAQLSTSDNPALLNAGFDTSIALIDGLVAN